MGEPWQLSSGLWQIAGMLLAAALFWLLYFDLKDRLQPEPRHKLIFAFLLGVVACALARTGFWITEQLGVPDLYENGLRWRAVYCFLLIGPIEEGAKLLVAVLFVFRWDEFDELIDGLIYPAAIALGFASFENFTLVQGLPLWQQLARVFALPMTHTLFGAVWGYSLAYARFRLPPGGPRRWLQFGGITLAMALHGLYDFLIFAYQARIWVGALVLVLWSATLWYTHRLARAKLAPVNA